MRDQVCYPVFRDGEMEVVTVPVEKCMRTMWVSEEFVAEEANLLMEYARTQMVPEGYEPVPDDRPEMTLLYPGYPIPEKLQQAMADVGGRVVGSYFEHDEPLTLAVTRYVYRRL